MGESLTISVTVKNTGNRTGKETVLLYLNDVAASVSRPVKQLKAFKKIELTPGQQKTVTLTLMPDDLSFIGVKLNRIVEPGEFNVMIGNESRSFTLINSAESNL
jgi:beta-glucosidase